MEVLAIISSHRAVNNLFGDFLAQYPKIKELGRDVDTVFYSQVREDYNEIYYHWEFDDAAEEMAIAYSEENTAKINAFFGEKELHIFDIQFRSHKFVQALLNDFVEFLKLSGREAIVNDILVHDPFEGTKTLPIFKHRLS